MQTQIHWAGLLVFDLDGTLIDSRQDLADAVDSALRCFGRPDLPIRDIASCVGDGALTLIERAFERSGLDARDPQLLSQGHQHFLDFYKQHKLDHTHVYPGVLEALGIIRRRSPHILMACLTNKPVAPSRAICQALGLAPFFFQIYGGNSFASKKSHPLGLHRLIAEAATLAHDHAAPVEHPISATNTVMIGDGQADVLAARAAGIQVIGCQFGFSEQNLVSSPPDALVSSPSEWIQLLTDV